MRKYLVIIVSLLLVFVLLFTSCTDKKMCAKCGNPATHPVSGPAQLLEEAGIPLNKCNEITSNIYTAFLCDKCLDKYPVSTFPPDHLGTKDCLLLYNSRQSLLYHLLNVIH